MNKITKTILVILILSLFSLIAYPFINNYINYISTDNAQINGRNVIISSKINGHIQTILFKEGDYISENQTLIEIDNRDFSLTLKQAEQNLASLQAKKNEAESVFLRDEKLYKSGATTKQQYDSSLYRFNDLKAQLDSVKTSVEIAKLNLEYTIIKSPFNGYIAKKSAEVGQYINTGTPLIAIVDKEERWVIANFKETEIENLKIGQNVHIIIDALSKKEYKGNIEKIYPSTGSVFSLLPPDNATGNFTKIVQRVSAKITFKNLNKSDLEFLKIGLSANIKVDKN